MLAGRGPVEQGRKFEGLGGPATAMSRWRLGKAAVGGGTRGDGGETAGIRSSRWEGGGGGSAGCCCEWKKTKVGLGVF
ncbi:unnamed protein product [Linum trigynum]|uniref:Uncharacterized protein n=1 Tax=Linum trigynum TaxID=586398 RepID=A0AAV2CT59_9ROSI